MQLSHRSGLNAGAALALIAAAAPAGAQVNNFNIFKTGYYSQTDASSQTLQNYFFNSTVFAQNATDAIAATLMPGAGTSVNYSYTPSPSFPGAFLNYGSSAFASQADLDTAFPQGPYIVNYGGGTETPGNFTVAYSTDVYATSNPLFTAMTFNGLQNLDTSKAFTLNWNANIAPTAASEAFNFLNIYDATTGNLVFSDGSGFLAPNVTSATLPAGTLLPNTSYFVGIDFSDRIDGSNAAVTDSNGNNVFVTQSFDLSNTVNFTTARAAVPEPSSFALLALGALPLGLLAAKRRRSA